MLSTKKYNNNSLVYANTATFDNVSINESITNDSLTTNIYTISGNINTINGNVNTISGTVNTLNNQLNSPSTYIGLNTGTVPTQSLINGNTIYIGSSTSNVYINGNLYYNGSLIYRSTNTYSNAVAMAEYILQI